ncbi:MAG TPA: nucleotide sugar dehydrogenase [Dongiaceae bacterium]|nr:nucleotide sugar dehydrogenase [Dongiaceae bacterium]
MFPRSQDRHAPASGLRRRIAEKKARIGIIGLGYVGLPLACLFAERGFAVTGFDIDRVKATAIMAGKSYIRHIPGVRLRSLVKKGILSASTDFAQLAEMDCIIACVPTPLTHHREPDLRFVRDTAQEIARNLRRRQLVVFESTTYPGTNREVVLPILAETGLECGRDFFLAYSPEREDPGNGNHSTATIPKIVGADDAASLALAKQLYGAAIPTIVPVMSSATAEAVKLTENIFRAVNIALVNELKLVFDRMNIDIWEVIEAAKTKPFGFMPFYPGPGLGGHCIPIDPFYLTWKAREYGIATRFIELAGEINTAMPRHVVTRLGEALSRRGKPLWRARILLLGLAYKKNIDDMRESPALALWRLLEAQGARVGYHDPYIPAVKPSREFPELAGKKSTSLTPAALRKTDAVLIVTDHDAVDYAQIAKYAPLVVDTRNVMARLSLNDHHTVKA